jgi:aspartate aminotransferase
MSLRQAISNKLKVENGLNFAPAQIVVGNGAKQAVCNTILAIVDKGDEVIIPTPAWVSYFEMVKLAEGKNVTINAGYEQGFKITGDQLEAAITPATKAIILCSPSNPTGAVYSREELADLVRVLAKHPRIIVIADEIYEHINYVGRHESIAQFPELADRVVVINGVSKAYAMTGWRIGYCAAPLWIAKACTKLQGQYTSGPSSIAQKAAEAAYTGSQDCVGLMRQAFETRRNLIVQLAGEIPGFNVAMPDGAFYIFPEVSSLYGKRYQDRVINNCDDLAMYFLEVGLVATVAGSAFGAPECIRMSYATSADKISEAMRRIKECVANLE